MKELVTNLLRSALLECCSPALVKRAISEQVFLDAADLALEDLVSFSEKDPAAHGNAHLVATQYLSYKAVLHYRLANALSRHADATRFGEFEYCASFISARGKLLSGAEIHHRCSIGRRFILDHGMGTVIGETSVIGNDCYVLGGVTIGSTGITGNARGKRHPTIGDRVQIGAFARLFGPISVGDDVFIGPHCVIKEDLLPGSVVTIRTQTQITRRHKSDIAIQPHEAI